MTVYDEILVPRLFNPWGQRLLDGVGVAPGASVLDVACGPGTVARLAAARAGRSGHVTACDFSPAMLGVAAAKAPLEGAADITYRLCPADALDVPDGGFDVVVCQQGLQFFPDRVAALTEMRRAVKPGGRAGVSVWCAIEESPFFVALAGAVGEVFGKEAELGYRAGPWGLTARDELARLFDDAGFTDVRVTRETLPVVFEGGPAQILASLATSALGPQVAALDDQGRADLVAAGAAALGSLVDSEGRVCSDTVTHFVRATR
jgi:SAM-dependent methyltransferase